jgi:putative DNA primase/helicase
MVALVEHVESGPTAIHRTFLRDDGSAKADTGTDKASLGPVGGGAVRLTPIVPDEWLVVGEGIETTLSVMQACGLPGWAALSAGGIEKLVLPREAPKIIIAIDNDESGRGQQAAQVAAQRWLAEGRCVRAAIPPGAGDFNDILTEKPIVHE